MPGWHDAVKDLVQSGQLAVLAITQEQHADRCRLFAQWHQFDFPILHDPVNWTRATAVPIVTAIDEGGIVRSTRPTPDWVRNTFVTTKYSSRPAEKQRPPSLTSLQAQAQARPTASAFRALGDAQVLWSTDVNQAIAAYQRAVELGTEPIDHFRLGVAYRQRYDSPQRRAQDFRQAVEQWTTALAEDPNQYIWRRRIQQYGPRLDKPYPFYDWIAKAEQEVHARGERPIKVRVALSGAEIAHPSKAKPDRTETTSPDPQNKVRRDAGEFVQLETTVVPARVAPGEHVRVHLTLRPTQQAVWNNETGPLTVWVQSQEHWQPHPTLIEYPVPQAAESNETRHIELEVHSGKAAGETELVGFVLYAVCEKSSGTCLFRRQDFRLALKLAP